MSARWDGSLDLDLPEGPFASAPRPGGNAWLLGLQAEPAREAVDAVDLALARQELLAAANASNPLTRAIIMHVAAYVARIERDPGPGAPTPVPERYRG